jgi:hypothetical protein
MQWFAKISSYHLILAFIVFPTDNLRFACACSHTHDTRQIFLIHSAVCFIPWYLFERERLPGDADYEAPESAPDMWSDRDDSNISGGTISYGSTLESPITVHATSSYFQAGDSAESVTSVASTPSQYSIVSPRRLSNRLTALHDRPPPLLPSPSAFEFTLSLVRIALRDYNFWAAFAFVVGSLIYIWSAVLSVLDLTDPQIVWWEFAGGLVFLLDSYFYLASWHTHHAAWRPCGRSDPAVQLDWLWCVSSGLVLTVLSFAEPTRL